MSEDLKREFYAACPVWYWPVLWWQFLVMEQYLASLYAALDGAEMTYGLALGPRGTLRLIYLSDTARRFLETGQVHRSPCFSIRAFALENPQPTHTALNAPAAPGADTQAPVQANLASIPLYLDPG